MVKSLLQATETTAYFRSNAASYESFPAKRADDYEDTRNRWICRLPVVVLDSRLADRARALTLSSVTLTARSLRIQSKQFKVRPRAKWAGPDDPRDSSRTGRFGGTSYTGP